MAEASKCPALWRNMVSNSQSLDLFSVRLKSLVWESVSLQIDTNMILEDQMRKDSLQCSGSRSFEYFYMFPQQHRQCLCCVYFYKRKNSDICNFCFQTIIDWFYIFYYCSCNEGGFFNLQKYFSNLLNTFYLITLRNFSQPFSFSSFSFPFFIFWSDTASQPLPLPGSFLLERFKNLLFLDFCH